MTQTAIKSFLIEFKQVAKVFGILYVSRSKNSLQTLADIGITAKQREEIIYNLTIENYCEGPRIETQMGGNEMWVFGKTIHNTQLYIKLTISQVTNGSVCISFHKAEYPMVLPYSNLT